MAKETPLARTARVPGKARKPAQRAGAKAKVAKPKKKRKRPLKKRLEVLVEEMVSKGIRLPEAHDQLEKLFLVEALRQADGNQCRAAARLDMHRNTLRRKLDAHGLL